MKNRGHSGYTLPEIMMVSLLMMIALGVILNAYLYSERYFQAGTAQIIANGNARKVFRRISHDIRRASSVTIYANYGPGPTVSNPGNYIEIDLPTGPDPGYYFNASNQIRYIPDLSADNQASESDDTLMAANIYGANIFQNNGGAISIALTGFSASAGPGYQAVDIGTLVRPRN